MSGLELMIPGSVGPCIHVFPGYGRLPGVEVGANRRTQTVRTAMDLLGSALLPRLGARKLLIGVDGTVRKSAPRN